MGNLHHGTQLVCSKFITVSTLTLIIFIRNLAPGGTVASWRESYEKAARLVDQMSLVEKVNITTGTGWQMGPCVGNTGVSTTNTPYRCSQQIIMSFRPRPPCRVSFSLSSRWSPRYTFCRQHHGFPSRCYCWSNMEPRTNVNTSTLKCQPPLPDKIH